jgi:hypothetical protein
VSFRIVGGGTGQAGYPAGFITKVTDATPSPTVGGQVYSYAGSFDVTYPFLTAGSTAGHWNFGHASGNPPGATALVAVSFTSH